MEIEDFDDDLAALDATPAGPPQRRRGPVRAESPAQERAVAPAQASATKGGLFGFGKAAEEPRPFTPLSDDAQEPAGASAERSPGDAPKPAPTPAPKPVDRATALLQQLEAKAEQQKAGAWGRPSRSAAAAGAPKSAGAGTAAAGAGARAPGGAGAQGSSYNAQGAAPPVLNDSKIEFARRRWLQTNLGGPKLLTPSGCAPPGLVLVQMLLWLLPVVVGVPLSVLADSMSSPWLAPTIAAGATLALHSAIQAVRMSGGSRVAPVGDASGKTSMLLEEDEVDFALFSRQGLAFLVPALGWAALPYGVCSAALVGVATVYLSPDRTSIALRQSALEGAGVSGATAGYLACGWLCTALAAYSLNAHAPPEPNRYSPLEAGGVLGPTSRALHMLLIMVPAVVWTGGDQVLTRALCAALPLLWATGSLPPADCLIEWALEQAHVHLHGGSVAASPLRLAVMLAASWAVLALTTVLHESAGRVAALAAACPLCFLLSHDIAPSPTVIPPATSGDAAPSIPLWAWRRLGGSGMAAAWRLLALVLLVVLPVALPTTALGSAGDGAHVALNVMVLVLCVVCRGASLLQRPYLMFLLANPAARGSAVLSAQGSAPGWRRGLQAVHAGSARVGALLLVVYVIMVSGVASPSLASRTAESSNTVLVVWRLLAVLRALRKAWQTPAGALSEAAVAIWVGDMGVHRGCSAGLGMAGWCAMSTCEQWLVVGWAINVLLDVVSKMQFLMTLAITSWTDVRQRARLASTYLTLLCLGLPFALVIVVAAAMLSAPLLPVLGVPLFIVGFPRPRRHWPSTAGSQSASLDAAYYKHLMPSAVKSLLGAINTGQLGSDVRGGEIFLLRRDALLVMVQVLERGCGWAQVLCKGLELQETSCHHLEAGTVEEIMDSALGDCTLSTAPPALPWKNPWTMNTLEPLSKIPATVYSLADTQLTGVIDRPENADELPRFFARALLWLLRQREAANGPAPAAWFDLSMLQEIEGRSLDSTKGSWLWDAPWAEAIGLWPPAPPPQKPPQLPVQQAPRAHVATAAPPPPAAQPAKAATPPPAAAPAAVAPKQAGAKSGGFWRKKDPAPEPQKESWAAQTSATPTRAVAVLPGSTPGAGRASQNVDDLEVDDLDDLLNEFAVAGGNFGSGQGQGDDDLDADALLDELEETLNESPSRPANHSSSAAASPSAPRAHASLGVHDDPLAADAAPSSRSSLGSLYSSDARPQDKQAGASLKGAQTQTQTQTQRKSDAELRRWLGACWGIVEDWGHLSSKSGPEHTTMVCRVCVRACVRAWRRAYPMSVDAFCR